MTIKSVIENGVEVLGDRNNALLDVEILLAFVLGVEKEYLIMNSREDVDENLLKLFFKYLKRVEEGEPIAYILKEKEFYGLSFFVDERVLIPRPETEHLVERVVKYLKKNSVDGRRFTVLDVGTGSGNISISIAKSFTDEDGVIEQIDAVDFDDGAIDVAKLNADQHGVSERVCVFQSDLLDFLDGGEKYDVIVANLPYIGVERNRHVSVETEKYEPNIALFGGKGGLELYKKMFQELLDKDVSFDILVGEFGFAQSEELGELLDKYFTHKWVIDKDLAGVDRMFVVKN